MVKVICARCGHDEEDHDAGECWHEGDNVSDERQCPRSWYATAVL